MIDKSIVKQIIIETIRTYVEIHPRPAQVNQLQAAEMLGLSSPTVRKMVRSGQLRLNDCGLIPITEIDRALVAKVA